MNSSDTMDDKAGCAVCQHTVRYLTHDMFVLIPELWRRLCGENIGIAAQLNLNSLLIIRGENKERKTHCVNYKLIF